MEWWIWITTWIILNIIYSRLFWVYFKKHNENNDNPLIRIYVSKIENRLTFNIKTRFYLGLLTPGTMKIMGSAENKITKDKQGANVPHLEITEVASVHSNIVNNLHLVVY